MTTYHPRFDFRKSFNTVRVFGLLVTSVLTIVVASGSVDAQQQPRVVVPVALPSSIDAATRSQLEPILNRARDRGLPVSALTNKAAEGVLRGVTRARIVAAVEALEERLTTARLALSPAQPEDIIAGADALHAGINVDVLRGIRRHQPTKSVAVPLAVLAQLVSQGVSQGRATEIVYKLLNKGVTAQQLLALRQDVNTDILAGRSVAQAVDERVATVLAALGRSGTTTNASMPSALPGDGLIQMSAGGKKK